MVQVCYLRLFEGNETVSCRLALYGWQGWKWIEIWKNWPVFSNFDATSSKNCQEIYYG